MFASVLTYLNRGFCGVRVKKFSEYRDFGPDKPHFIDGMSCLGEIGSNQERLKFAGNFQKLYSVAADQGLITKMAVTQTNKSILNLVFAEKDRSTGVHQVERPFFILLVET